MLWERSRPVPSTPTTFGRLASIVGDACTCRKAKEIGLSLELHKRQGWRSACGNNQNGQPEVAAISEHVRVRWLTRPCVRRLRGTFLLGALVAWPLSIRLAGAQITPADAFKDLLAHLPVVKEISFTELRCADGRPPQWFTGAIAATNFFLREHLPGENVDAPLSPTNLMGVPYFVGASRGKRWEIAGLTVFESEEATDPVFVLAEKGVSILDKALAFGLPSIRPGSFTWDGDRFTAAMSGPIPVSGKHTIHGFITVSNAVAVRLDSPDAALTVYYDYSPGTLPTGVPSQATVCLYGKPKSDPRTVTAIHRLETATDLPEQYFEPYRHIVPQYVGITRSEGARRVVVKDNAYAISLARSREADRRAGGRRPMILWSLVLVSLFFAAAIVYRRVKTVSAARRSGKA